MNNFLEFFSAQSFPCAHVATLDFSWKINPPKYLQYFFDFLDFFGKFSPNQ